MTYTKLPPWVRNLEQCRLCAAPVVAVRDPLDKAFRVFEGDLPGHGPKVLHECTCYKKWDVPEHECLGVLALNTVQNESQNDR